MKWEQRGYVITSDTPVDKPFFHGFYLPEWEANTQRDKLIAELPPHLRENIRVTPAVLQFEFPDQPTGGQ